MKGKEGPYFKQQVLVLLMGSFGGAHLLKTITHISVVWILIAQAMFAVRTSIFSRKPTWLKNGRWVSQGILTGLKSSGLPQVWKRSEAELETGGSRGTVRALSRWKG